MKLIKIPYYLNSLFQLTAHLKNVFSILPLIFKKKTVLKFKSGHKYYVQEPLDALILKETLFDDVYGISRLKKARIIIDVGAGFGDFSLFAARMFPKAVIHAFEPERRSAKLLEENIRLNHNKSITAHYEAIGTQRKYSLSVAKNATQSSVISNHRQKKYRVAARRLDEFVKNGVDILKIDCEGAEIDILKSITARNLKKVAYITLEYHDHIVLHESKKLLVFLKKHGFICTQIPDRYNSSLGIIHAKRSS